jgi:hypothetical protein
MITVTIPKAPDYFPDRDKAIKKAVDLIVADINLQMEGGRTAVDVRVELVDNDSATKVERKVTLFHEGPYVHVPMSILHDVVDAFKKAGWMTYAFRWHSWDKPIQLHVTNFPHLGVNFSEIK